MAPRMAGTMRRLIPTLLPSRIEQTEAVPLRKHRETGRAVPLLEALNVTRVRAAERAAAPSAMPS
jgi:hypothetical protein